MTAFGAAAARLAGQVGAGLGWSPDRFWRATPAEVAAVVRAMAGPDAPGVSADELERLREMWPDGR